MNGLACSCCRRGWSGVGTPPPCACSACHPQLGVQGAMFAEAATAALSRRVADLERRLAAIERPVGLGGTTIYEGPIL